MTTVRNPGTRITQQFRERHNMTYELDCDGIALVLRMFPPDDVTTFEWRVEARTRPENASASASAPTRRQAVRDVAQWCVDHPVHGLSIVDWDAVERALVEVRAL